MTCYNPKYARIETMEQYNDKTGELIGAKKNIHFLHKDEALRVDTGELKDGITVIPCQKCSGCALDKSNDWATRCIMEMKNWKHSYFVTLTYDDEHIPMTTAYKSPKDLTIVNHCELVPRDLQLFMKKLRKHYKGELPRTYKGETEYPIRFFGAGEYGSKTERCHFHLALFNIVFDDLKLHKMVPTKFGKQYPIYTSDKLAEIWENGFITIEELNYETAAYIARYVLKKAFGKDKRYWEAIEVHPEYTTTSKRGGIGFDLMNNKEEWEKIIRNYGIFTRTQSGKTLLKKIPSAVRQQWKERDEVEYYILNEKHNEEVNKAIEERNKQINVTPREQRLIELRTLNNKIRQLKRNQI